MSNNLPHIIIAGFGETGVLSAIHLNHKYKHRYRISAISSKPSLVSGQELGARLTEPKAWQANYYTDFKRYKQLQGVTIIHGLVSNINSRDKSLTVSVPETPEQEINFDVLLIASGVTNGFWRSAQLQTDQEIKYSLDEYAQRFEKSDDIAIVGGGPSGASCSYHLKMRYPNKNIAFYYSAELPLPHHHPKTRTKVVRQLAAIGVNLLPLHRAASLPLQTLTSDAIAWSTGQKNAQHDLVLWTTGQTVPNSDFLPRNMLDDNGFVNTDRYLKVAGESGIFCIGDIANTDKNRSSARNFAFQLVAHNIDCYLRDKPKKMKAYKAPIYRWGSVLGVQSDGMRVYTPKGGMFRFPRWSIQRLLFPIFVNKAIYRGVKKEDVKMQ